MSTDYHSQYWAWELTRRRASDESGKFSSTFYNATVDLNPHQPAVDRQRDGLISRVEAQLVQKVEMKKLFEIRWRVV
jgi:hypothetical protein